MSALGHALHSVRRPRRAALALAAGAATLALPLVGATTAHAEEYTPSGGASLAQHITTVAEHDGVSTAPASAPSARAAGTAVVAVPAAFTTAAHTAPATATSLTATAVGAPATTAGDVAPLAALHITEQYGVAGPWAAGHHTGVDLAAAVGTSVRSVGEGTVVRSGWDGAYGIDVVVHLSDGKYALYGHLSQALVSAGEHVTAGQEIGRSGATGHVTGPHLHFEVRTTLSYGSDVNPVAYLRAHGVAI